MNHTPTPWKIAQSEPYFGYMQTQYKQIQISVAEEAGVGEQVICNVLMPRHIENEGNGISNAEFIVTACNAHDDLIDVLKTVLGAIEEGEHFHCTENNRKLITQAIAKAEGK